MTESARQALIGLRDFTTLQWYVVPLLALLFYVYVVEIRDARRTGNWDAVIAGVTLFSADFVNESINGWIFAISGYSALWLAPGRPRCARWSDGTWRSCSCSPSSASSTTSRSTKNQPRKCSTAEPLVLGAVLLGRLGDRGAGAQQGRTAGLGLPLVEPRPRGSAAIFVFGYLWFYLAAKFAIERSTLKAKVMVPSRCSAWRLRSTSSGWACWAGPTDRLRGPSRQRLEPRLEETQVARLVGHPEPAGRVALVEHGCR